MKINNKLSVGKVQKKVLEIYLILFQVFLIQMLTGCTFKQVIRNKNIPYVQQHIDGKSLIQKLSVFAPKKNKQDLPVFIFIHGGNWNSGNKSLYSFFANRLARKGIVGVVIDYPLSPIADYKNMAEAVVASVKWVKDSIQKYGGNPKKIFISGHSAGGHLAALVGIDDVYFEAIGIKNPIQGIVLIDAAGLDMFGYLKEQKFSEEHTYLKTFSKSANDWKNATPLYHLHQGMPPILILRGEKTYPSIKSSNEKFAKALKVYQPNFDYTIQKRKKHIPMITQFYNSYNPMYALIIDFIIKNPE